MSQEKNQVKLEKIPKWQIQAIYKRIVDKTKFKTNTAIAKFFGVTSQAVGQWEQGINPPALHKLYFFSLYFNLSLEWLINGEGPESRTDLKRAAGEAVEEQGIDVEKLMKDGIKKFLTDTLTTVSNQTLQEILGEDQPAIRKKSRGGK